MKKHFNKELVMTKKENENFENSTKCWICDNDYIDYIDVISLENIEVLRIEIVNVRDVKSQNSCCISQPKKL